VVSEVSDIGLEVEVLYPVLVSVTLAVPPGQDSSFLGSPAVWGEAPLGVLDVVAVLSDSLSSRDSSSESSEGSVSSSSDSVSDLFSKDHVLLLVVSESGGSGIIEENGSPVSSVVGNLGDEGLGTLLLLRHVDDKSSVGVLLISELLDGSEWRWVSVAQVVVEVPLLLRSVLAVVPGKDSVLLGGPAVRSEAP